MNFKNQEEYNAAKQRRQWEHQFATPATGPFWYVVVDGKEYRCIGEANAEWQKYCLTIKGHKNVTVVQH